MASARLMFLSLRSKGTIAEHLGAAEGFLISSGTASASLSSPSASASSAGSSIASLRVSEEEEEAAARALCAQSTGKYDLPNLSLLAKGPTDAASTSARERFLRN